MRIVSARLPDRLGPEGEALTMDTAIYAPKGAESMFVVTSGVHGPEGFCGSGCQVGMLNDDELFGVLAEKKCALLLVHAVNPFGFAHLRRVNEDNVDLNRNAVDHAAARELNPAYEEVERLLLPHSWPPTPEAEEALEAYASKHGERAVRAIAAAGQYRVADGMFFGGNSVSWSTRELRSIFLEHASAYRRVALVDIHTGLGPFGHAEKIFLSKSKDELQRAHSWWGADVRWMYEPGCVSTETSGSALFSVYDLPSHVEKTTLGIEYGTYEEGRVFSALRGDHWLHKHPECGAEQNAQIKQAMKDAFYPDTDEWKGAVYGQIRVIALQAVSGLTRQ